MESVISRFRFYYNYFQKKKIKQHISYCINLRIFKIMMIVKSFEMYSWHVVSMSWDDNFRLYCSFTFTITFGIVYKRFCSFFGLFIFVLN